MYKGYKIVVKALLDETSGRLKAIIPNGTKTPKLDDAESIVIITKEMLSKLNYFAIKD